MKINIEEHPHYTSLTLEGELTIYSVTEVKSLLLPHVAGTRELEVNLAQVSEIDSAGIQLLLLMKREFSCAKKLLRLNEHSRAVLEIFERYNLGAYFGDPLLISGAANDRGSAR